MAPDPGASCVPFGQSRKRNMPAIGVPREITDGESRVALVPAVVERLRGAGHELIVETGAGEERYSTTRTTRRPAPSSATRGRRM